MVSTFIGGKQHGFNPPVEIKESGYYAIGLTEDSEGKRVKTLVPYVPEEQ